MEKNSDKSHGSTGMFPHQFGRFFAPSGPSSQWKFNSLKFFQPQRCRHSWLWISQPSRLGYSFLIRTLGKGTDTATTLELEKSRRIYFLLGRWVTRGKKTPKSLRKHFSWAVGLFFNSPFFCYWPSGGIHHHNSPLWPWESLFSRPF